MSFPISNRAARRPKYERGRRYRCSGGDVCPSDGYPCQAQRTSCMLCIKGSTEALIQRPSHQHTHPFGCQFRIVSKGDLGSHYCRSSLPLLDLGVCATTSALIHRRTHLSSPSEPGRGSRAGRRPADDEQHPSVSADVSCPRLHPWPSQSTWTCRPPASSAITVVAARYRGRPTSRQRAHPSPVPPRASDHERCLRIRFRSAARCAALCAPFSSNSGGKTADTARYVLYPRPPGHLVHVGAQFPAELRSLRLAAYSETVTDTCPPA